ncbi:amidohydrolase [Balneolales bacterium ANBcel1]|nr:amidohydrolase [Balneolales bacterium ANBcel1]
MDLVQIRKELHTLAETAHNEEKTAAFVAEQLREAGVEDITEGIGGHGLLAVLDSGREGPSLLYRAELDALTIHESLDIPYASLQEGVSHKCGHDGHIAILIGLARDLQANPLRRGKVYLLFQPAEETGEGAERMLQDDKWPDIAPDHVFALHNLPGYPLHSVLLGEGVFAAGSCGLIVRLKGSTSHAAHPENARSPSSAVAALIRDWQALPRTIIPFDRAGLVTIIHARIGERAFGTTPGYAELMATLRAHQPDDLKRIGEKAVEMTRSVASQWRLDMDYEWTESFEPVSNTPESVALVEEVARGLAESRESGKGAAARVSDVRHIPRPFSWSEDFGHFTKRYHGALFGLGAGEQHPQMHDAEYDFPDELLETGLALFLGIADRLKMR